MQFKMKKLLQVNVVANSGSTGRIAEEIGKTAMANGWQSYIAYGRNDSHSQSQLIRIGSDWDVKMHGIQTRLFDRHGFASKKATNKLIQKIDWLKPDVIHLHNLHGYYINIELLFNYLKKTNIPIVWTLHDCWPVTGHCVYFDFIRCEKWKTQCNRCPQKATYPASYFIDRSKKNFIIKKELFSSMPNLTLVSVSQWLANIIEQSFLKNSSLRVISNGIDTDVFQPVPVKSILTKYSLDHKFILLGVANVWSPRKGLMDFVELSKKLDSDYQIILVGLTQKQINTLPKNIIGFKRTESIKELVELYSTADVVLNISYEETFGMTTVEGFACGTPGIVYNATASPELIDNATGIIVEKGDIEGLGRAIQQIKNKEKKFYTEACIERARRFYRNEDRYQEYLDLYESILVKQ